MPVNAGRGSYRLAAQAEQQIPETRGKLAKYVHALSDEDVHVTASATMAANVILARDFHGKKGILYLFRLTSTMRSCARFTDNGRRKRGYR